MQSDHNRATRFMRLPFVVTLAMPIVTFAGGTAIVKQTAEVRASPSSNAQQVTQAPVNEQLEVVDRRGAWYEVNSSSGWRGWIRLAAIRLTSLTQKKSGTSASGLFEPAATVGVRGLDEGSLARAQPDYAALQRLRAYRASPQDADRFAAELARTRGAAQ